MADALLAAVAGALAPEASALIQNKPYTLSPEQIAQFQAVVDAALPTDAATVVDAQQPTHCDEPWLIQLNGPTGTEPVVLNLAPAAWQNKPFTLSADQLSQLGLPVPTDSNLASSFKLNVTDVLLTPADGVTPPALQVNGAPVNANTLNLRNLLGADAAPTQLTATGTVQQDGQSFTYQVDATLQAMIDQQHLQHATMS
ncbi:hypothetical protein [Limnohabitans sp.]|uniref:hypothetical protein n=1 Tax=Limnohabitans sp. TaxID=1907725 RepID=UPI0026154B1B|nr:hypothetical protein [Limnohabitans sp.]